MTDNQLRVLLKQIAARIDTLADSVEPFVKSGERERENTWIGEGTEPIFSFQKNTKDWELKPTGEYTAVEMIRWFAESLRIDSMELKQPDNSKKMKRK
jgi:hypothetical protein